MYCLVPEKPLRLFIPLFFSGGIWNFLLSTPRAFPGGTISDTFYEFIKLIGREKMILNIAHRGARSIAPENTLTAAQKAYDEGAHMWETDIGVTKDEKLILFHNHSMELTTDVKSRYPDRDPWRYTSFTLDEIKRLDAGSWFVKTDPHQQILAGNISQTDLNSYSGVKVPTLTEALELTQKLNWKINLELKVLPDKMKHFPVLDHVLHKLEKMEFSIDQFVISSFNWDWLRKIQKQKPEYRVEALIGYPEIKPLNWGDFEFASYNVNRKLTTPEEIKKVTQKGIKINLYNINDKNDMIEFIEAGASGIITDYPQTMTKMEYCR
jgi:glycerophosphoryl diester phosphodiesterase